MPNRRCPLRPPLRVATGFWQAGLENVVTFAVGLIPWICRVVDYGRVGVTYGCKAVNVAAVSPRDRFDALNEVFLSAICERWLGKGASRQSDSFLSLTLSVDNQIIHPHQMGRAGSGPPRQVPRPAPNPVARLARTRSRAVSPWRHRADRTRLRHTDGRLTMLLKHSKVVESGDQIMIRHRSVVAVMLLLGAAPSTVPADDFYAARGEELLRLDPSQGIGPGRLVFEPETKIIGPGRLVFGPEKKLIGPGRLVLELATEVIGSGRLVFEPETEVIGSGRLMFEPGTSPTRTFETGAKHLYSSSVQPIKLPPRSPSLNAYAERFVRSIKEECPDRVVVLGENHLRFLVQGYVEHHHDERNHQGLDNQLLSRAPPAASQEVVVQRRERIGGLLNYYHREAS